MGQCDKMFYIYRIEWIGLHCHIERILLIRLMIFVLEWVLCSSANQKRFCPFGGFAFIKKKKSTMLMSMSINKRSTLENAFLRKSTRTITNQKQSIFIAIQ